MRPLIKPRFTFRNENLDFYFLVVGFAIVINLALVKYSILFPIATLLLVIALIAYIAITSKSLLLFEDSFKICYQHFKSTETIFEDTYSNSIKIIVHLGIRTNNTIILKYNKQNVTVKFSFDWANNTKTIEQFMFLARKGVKFYCPDKKLILRILQVEETELLETNLTFWGPTLYCKKEHQNNQN